MMTRWGASPSDIWDAPRWQEIYDLNQDVLKSPDNLTLGSVIRLPSDASRVGLAPDGDRRRDKRSWRARRKRPSRSRGTVAALASVPKKLRAVPGIRANSATFECAGERMFFRFKLLCSSLF